MILSKESQVSRRSNARQATLAKMSKAGLLRNPHLPELVKKYNICQQRSKKEFIPLPIIRSFNVVDLIRLKLGNEDSSSFWKDKWYAGGVIKELFPRLYALELHKHATVRMKLMALSLDNSFRRRVRSRAEESQFNFLLESVQVINLVPCEDRYFWSLKSEGDYSVASIR
nr:RNA-directed DNA polymerase, eukaryota, reverse transcriptase zinc-binding domain protein [Tanacetum cinerariifolium]